MILKKIVLICSFCFIHISLHSAVLPRVNVMNKNFSQYVENNFKKLCKKPAVQAIMPLVLIYSGIKVYNCSFMLGTLLGKELRRWRRGFDSLRRKIGIHMTWFGSSQNTPDNIHTLPDNLPDLQEEGPECCICHDVLSPAQRVTLHPCRHNDYHRQCVQRWFREQDGGQTCPYCRTPVDWIN